MPSDLDAEDVFLPMGPINLSMRQVASLAAGGISWFLCGSIIEGLLGSLAFGMILCAWMPVAGFIMAFTKVKGRWFEEWAADWVYYQLTPRHYALVDEQESTADERDFASDVDWDFAADLG